MREKAMPLCLIPQILHTLRENIYHHCLGKDTEIPQKRELRESYKEYLSFILKICKNSKAIVHQRTRHMVLDLTILSFNCSRHK